MVMSASPLKADMCFTKLHKVSETLGRQALLALEAIKPMQLLA